MLQIDFLLEILKQCKQNGIHTAVDTAGNVPWDNFQRIIPYVDLFLYDVKCVSDNLHKEYVGGTNRLILENLQKLSKEQTEIIIRIPVILEVNGNACEMQKIASFLKDLKVKNVELLPYHAMGEHKYHALEMDARTFAVPTKESISELKKLFNN